MSGEKATTARERGNEHDRYAVAVLGAAYTGTLISVPTLHAQFIIMRCFSSFASQFCQPNFYCCVA